jgi:hypothetical protein
MKKKNQNGVVLVKNKKNKGLQPGFVGSTRQVTPGHDFSYFFFNPV